MTLIKLKTDDKNIVIASGWANPSQRKAGDVTNDGFTVYNLSDEEIETLVLGHTELNNGHLVVDADYVEPEEPEYKPEPSAEQKAIATLTKKLAEQSEKTKAAQAGVVSLTRQMAHMKGDK